MANQQNPTTRFYAKKLGEMWDNKWTIIDACDDSILRTWRGPKRGRGRMWTGTEMEAEELAALMNRGAPTELGHVSVVQEAFDPPTRENARMAAIITNAERKRTRLIPVTSFHRCQHCKKMVKDEHTCLPDRDT